MASQKKYITLKEASVISGYTVKELHNFIKIGLITAGKKKNKIVVPFDAFEKISEQTPVLKSQKSAPKNKRVSKTKSMTQKPITSLVPFVKPHPTMLKVLESTALAAAMAMAVHVGMIPTVAEKVVYGLDLTQETIAYMGGTVEELMIEGVKTPIIIGEKIAGISTLHTADGYNEISGSAKVAGTSVEATNNLSGSEKSFNLVGIIEGVLIGIADASESFERSLDSLQYKTNELIIQNLQFENLDHGIQKFFQL